MEYRVYKTDSKTGKTEDIPKEKVRGFEEFMDSWEQSPDTPQEFSGGGWQNSDEEHEPGKGKTAYRIVYKTLKTVIFPELTLSWPNMRVVFANGDINRGGSYVPTSIPGRNGKRHVIPEYGRVIGKSRNPTYLPCPDLRMEISGWEDAVKAVCYVEIIYLLDDPDLEDPERIIAAGREGTASLRTLLDLKFGPRLLAMPLTEEAGEAFADWHWNRRLDTGVFSAESQASFRQLPGHDVGNEVRPIIDQHQARSPEERRRITLACQWYWRADSDTEPTTRFLSWWFVVEALEMSGASNIRPIRSHLARIFEGTEEIWKQPIGQLSGMRGKIVHGKVWTISSDVENQVRSLAIILLCSHLLGFVPDDVGRRFSEAMGIDSARLRD